MSDSQLPKYSVTLPAGHSVKEYEIKSVLAFDDYSVLYLATNAVHNDVILVEYLPRLIAERNQQTYHLRPKTVEDVQKYKWGLSAFVYKNYDLMTIHHPHIINYEKCFKANNTAYMVTDNLSYNNGTSLEDFMNHASFSMSEKDVKSLLEPLLDGLQLIHSRGHTHGNLTPENIYINETIDNPLITRLADAKHIFRYYKKQQVPIVTPGYSPCEQYYTHDEVGAWTDIFSLGSILYRLISGVVPVSSASRLASVVDHQKDPLVPLATLVKQSHQESNVSYSEKLLSAIDHAMALQANDRPQSVNEWRNELEVKPLVIEQPKLVVSEKPPSTNTATSEGSTHVDEHQYEDVREANLVSEPKHLNNNTTGTTTFEKPAITQNKLTAAEEADRTRAYLEKNIKRKEIDFTAISQMPFEVTKTDNKRNRSVATIMGTLLIFLFGFGGYYFFSQEDKRLDDMDKTVVIQPDHSTLQPFDVAVKRSREKMLEANNQSVTDTKTDVAHALEERLIVSSSNNKDTRITDTDVADTEEGVISATMTDTFDSDSTQVEATPESSVSSMFEVVQVDVDKQGLPPLTPLRMLDVPLVETKPDVISTVINLANEFPVVASFLKIVSHQPVDDQSEVVIGHSVIKASSLLSATSQQEKRVVENQGDTDKNSQNKQTRGLSTASTKKAVRGQSQKGKAAKVNTRKKNREDYQREWLAKQERMRREYQQRFKAEQAKKNARKKVATHKKTAHKKPVHVSANRQRQLALQLQKQREAQKRKKALLKKQQSKKALNEWDQAILDETDW